MMRLAQELAASVKVAQDNPKKNFGIERLKVLRATTFSRTTNPVDAEKWMEMIDRCCEVMRCPDDMKVGLAIFLLQGGAYDWWCMIQSRQGDKAISWTEFRKFFYDKFYPRSFCDMMLNEFLKLE